MRCGACGVCRSCRCDGWKGRERRGERQGEVKTVQRFWMISFCEIVMIVIRIEDVSGMQWYS